MKTRVSLLAVAAAVVAGFYLLVPGCGSSNNQQAAYVPGTTCIVGQVCTTSSYGLTGTSLLPGVVVTSIDSMGSTAQVQFGATSGYTSSYVYNGPVTMAGVVTFTGANGCPAGTYQLQGQGQWVANYGGHIAGVQGSFTLSGGAYGGMQGALNVLISQGQDPNVPSMASQYYMTGLFQTSCNPGGVAL